MIIVNSKPLIVFYQNDSNEGLKFLSSMVLSCICLGDSTFVFMEKYKYYHKTGTEISPLSITGSSSSINIQRSNILFRSITFHCI